MKKSETSIETSESNTTLTVTGTSLPTSVNGHSHNLSTGVVGITTSGNTLSPSNLGNILSPNTFISPTVYPYTISTGITTEFEQPQFIAIFTDKGMNKGFEDFKLRSGVDEDKIIGGLVLTRKLASEELSASGSLFAFGTNEVFTRMHIINETKGLYLFTLTNARVMMATLEGMGTINEEYLISFDVVSMDQTAKDYYNAMFQGVGK